LIVVEVEAILKDTRTANVQEIVVTEGIRRRRVPGEVVGVERTEGLRDTTRAIGKTVADGEEVVVMDAVMTEKALNLSVLGASDAAVGSLHAANTLTAAGVADGVRIRAAPTERIEKVADSVSALDRKVNVPVASVVGPVSGVVNSQVERPRTQVVLDVLGATADEEPRSREIGPGTNQGRELNPDKSRTSRAEVRGGRAFGRIRTAAGTMLSSPVGSNDGLGKGRKQPSDRGGRSSGTSGTSSSRNDDCVGRSRTEVGLSRIAGVDGVTRGIHMWGEKVSMVSVGKSVNNIVVVREVTEETEVRDILLTMRPERLSIDIRMVVLNPGMNLLRGGIQWAKESSVLPRENRGVSIQEIKTS